MKPIINSFSCSHKGLVRAGNQDFHLIDEELNLFILADGMGGHKQGEIASKVACETILLSISEKLKFDKTTESDGQILHTLSDAIREANLQIEDLNMGNHGRNAMGTTVACGIIYNSNLYFGNVGDSRIYFIDHETKRLSLLTKDHTMEMQAIERGIPPDLASQYRSTLTQAVGTHGAVEPHLGKINGIPTGSLFMTSDGFHDYFSSQEIQRMVLDENAFKLDISKKMISKALEMGGGDNITVLQINIG